MNIWISLPLPAFLSLCLAIWLFIRLCACFHYLYLHFRVSISSYLSVYMRNSTSQEVRYKIQVIYVYTICSASILPSACSPTINFPLPSLAVSRAYTYWMGASNTNPEGVWKWTDGRGVDGEVWGSEGLPTGRAPRCMAIKPAYRFGTLAESCHESKFFICQQERLL